MEGLFLGVQDLSDKVVIGTREGVVKARTAKRLDAVQRTDAELVRDAARVRWRSS